MCIPIPRKNTFPAMVIFLTGVALSEQDGLAAIAAMAVGVFAVALYAIPVYVFVSFIGEYGFTGAIEEISRLMGEWKDALKEWLFGADAANAIPATSPETVPVED